MTNPADTDWIELKIVGGPPIYIRPSMIMWFTSSGGSSTKIYGCRGECYEIAMSYVDFKAKMGIK